MPLGHHFAAAPDTNDELSRLRLLENDACYRKRVEFALAATITDLRFGKV